MQENQASRGVDVLGLAPYGEAAKIAVSRTADGIGALLSRICLPAAEEFGLMLKERVGRYRIQNLAAITGKTQELLDSKSFPARAHAHPRLVGKIIEEGSWEGDQSVQSLWAGLLASSCTLEGNDESNLIYVNRLAQMTSPQAKVLDYACRTSGKTMLSPGLVMATNLKVDLNTLRKVSGIDEIYILDRDLDHLRAIELIKHGFFGDSGSADITPTALALNLYVRCNGSRCSPAEFFNVEPPLAVQSDSNVSSKPPDPLRPDSVSMTEEKKE